MAEPVSNPETGGRSLADILREAGIENPSRSGRKRRWDDVDDAGLRQRQLEEATESPAGRPGYGRRSTDLPLDRFPQAGGGPPEERRARGDRRSRFDDAPPASRDRGPRAPVAPDPSTAAIPGLRPSRTPSVPTSASAPEAEERPEGRERRGRERRSRFGGDDQPASTGRIPGMEDGRGRAPAPPPSRSAAAPVEAEPARDLDGEPRERALAWLRFAGELVIAAVAGVAVYVAFGVLWQTFPHLAVIAAPLAVTGLVTGVQAWRQRTGRDGMGAPLLGVLVFAGTLLAVLPAAGLLAGT